MNTGMERKYNFYIKLYYEFRGTTEWIKSEIIKKRYDSFRYLLPVENKVNSNIIVEIFSYEDSKEKYMNIIIFLKIGNIITLPKPILKNLKISSQECKTIYHYLKETYFEEEKK